jgi:hypothetical protein
VAADEPVVPSWQLPLVSQVLEIVFEPDDVAETEVATVAVAVSAVDAAATSVSLRGGTITA